MLFIQFHSLHNRSYTQLTPYNVKHCPILLTAANTPSMYNTYLYYSQLHFHNVRLYVSFSFAIQAKLNPAPAMWSTYLYYLQLSICFHHTIHRNLLDYDDDLNSDCPNDSECLKQQSFRTCMTCVIWDIVLNRIHCTRSACQSVSLILESYQHCQFLPVNI